MSFYAGQKVVCVNDRPGSPGFRWDLEEAPICGEVYTVRRCFVDDDGDEILHLAEIARSVLSRKLWGQDAGYGAFRFRPVCERKTSIEVFRKLLNPSPKHVTEEA